MTEFNPRQLPSLRPFFSAVVRPRAGDNVYSAAVVDKTAGGAALPPVKTAFKNGRGDILFVQGFDWHLMMYGSNTAQALHSAAGSQFQQDAFEASFLDELTGQRIATLRYDSAAGVCALQGLTGQLHGFDHHVIAQLWPLSDSAKAQLSADIAARKITFVALPEKREVETALRAENGDYFIISNARTAKGYEGYRLFTGPSLDDLREIAITNIMRFRDGGTTYYRTAEGTLYTPTAFNPDLAPKWAAGEGKHNDLDKAGSPGITLAPLDRAEIGAALAQDTRITGMPRWQGPLVKPRDWRAKP